MSGRRRLAIAWIAACLGAMGEARAQNAGLTLTDAVRVTVAEQPAIHLQRERVAAGRADLQSARGQFDVSVASSFDRIRSETPNTVFEQQTQLLPPSSVANLTTYRLSAQKQLESGQIITPHIQVQRTDLSTIPTSASRASVGVDFVQPLLGGRRRDVVTAQMRASEIELRATTLDLQQIRSASVFQTAAAYWDYLAGQRRVEILRDAEQRARQLADETRVLIEAGNRPAADMAQVLANLADRTSTRIGADQALVEARHALGLAMGVASAAIPALPLPTDGFPAPVAAMDLQVDALVSLALRQRADLQSAARREESAQTITVAARDAIQPRLDFVGSVGYTGLDEGNAFWRYLTPFQRQVRGPNVTFQFAWSQFLDNNLAAGRLGRSLATEQQTRILRGDLTREIESAVSVAVDNLHRSAERVRHSREASNYYRSAVDDERVKQQLGRATVIDLINTEDRLTRTLLDQLSAEASYAVALARLRYETGTLISQDEATIDLSRVSTVPATSQP